jgi:hypothetical protein
MFKFLKRLFKPKPKAPPPKNPDYYGQDRLYPPQVFPESKKP